MVHSEGRSVEVTGLWNRRVTVEEAVVADVVEVGGDG